MRYAEQYIPMGAWLLIEKDMLPAKVGLIHLPTKAREDKTKITSTGTIVSKSPFTAFENDWERIMYESLLLGDRIGFGATIPLLSPAPPGYIFEGQDKTENVDDKADEGCKFVTLHVTDIIGVFCYTPEERSSFLRRFTRSASEG